MSCLINVTKNIISTLRKARVGSKEVNLLKQKLIRLEGLSKQKTVSGSYTRPSNTGIDYTNAKTITAQKQRKADAPWLLHKDAVWVQRVTPSQANILNRQMKGHGATDKQLFSLIENFGNPFVVKGKTGNTSMEVPLGTAKEVSDMYYNWLKDGTIPEGYPKQELDNLAKRRAYILSNLDMIRNAKELWYWREPDNNVTHVDALVKIATEEQLLSDISKDISQQLLPVKKRKNIVNIDSSQKGLEAALTNPTELARSKGNLQESYGIMFNGKYYKDVEEAYQKLKDTSEARTKPKKEVSKNYALMVSLIETKLKTFPRLVKAIDDRGGLEYLGQIVHQPTNKNTVWETGGQDWFKSALIDAYNSIKKEKSSGFQSKDPTFDKELDTKIRGILTKLYPEIKLEYTEDEIQYVNANGNVMNQEEVSKAVNYRLKVVDTLYDIGTAKPSKHGGESQPVRSTIKLNSKESPNIEVNLTKYLAGKGVSKEQIEYMFEYMRQNNIQEISTLNLAEKLLLGLTQNVEVKTAMEPELIYMEEEDYYEPTGDSSNIPSKVYQQLSVPGGTNYKEIEISTPNIKAYLKGHAEFATDEGIGWYRVDDEITNERFGFDEELIHDKTNTLRVLEMQSDMFQKRKDMDMTATGYIEYFTDIEGNTWRKSPDEAVWTVTVGSNGGMFRAPGDTYTQRESQAQVAMNKAGVQPKSLAVNKNTYLDRAFHQVLNTDNKWVRFFIQSMVQNAQRNGYEKIKFPNGETVAKIEGYTEEHGSDAVKEFYQVRVQNTLKKLYGKDKIKTVTDEHGNTWFELELDSKRDSQMIMLQRAGTDHITLEEIKTSDFNGTTYDIKNTAGQVVGNITVDFNTTRKAQYSRSDVAAKSSGDSNAKLNEKIIMINDLYIEPEFRGRYYGINALEEIMDRAKAENLSIMLDAYPTDSTKSKADLVSYYSSLGFVTNEQIAEKYGINMMILDKALFSKFLQRTKNGRIKGQANIEAGTVLINSLLQSQDTLPHEYAHHYIAWFRDTPIVQEAIKKWGGEEALVQAIGEQAVKQKGEAWNWWKKFTAWLQNKFNSLDKATKEELKNALTDAFLTREDLRKGQGASKENRAIIQDKLTAELEKAKERLSTLDNGIELLARLEKEIENRKGIC